MNGNKCYERAHVSAISIRINLEHFVSTRSSIADLLKNLFIPFIDCSEKKIIHNWRESFNVSLMIQQQLVLLFKHYLFIFRINMKFQTTRNHFHSVCKRKKALASIEKKNTHTLNVVTKFYEIALEHFQQMKTSRVR